jgi:succinate dehydrogenase/fumarate reductase flavoprotein subunit
VTMPASGPAAASGDVECDLLVAGGGAAGLAAAVAAAHHGLRVIVAEKAPVLGGATAWSGGWMWAPLNPLSRADGIVEDIEAPRTYLKHALGEQYDEPRVNAFLQNARHMVGFFEQNTALQFVSGSWIADITASCPAPAPGAVPWDLSRSTCGRSRRPCGPSCGPSSTRPRYSAWASWPARTCRRSCTPPPRSRVRARRLAVTLHPFDLLTQRHGMQLVNGTALIARLAKSADDLGVELRVNSPVTRLLTEDGAVTGAVVTTPDGDVTVIANRGVLLSTGGFPNDVERRRALFPRMPTGREHWTLPPAETTGDGISLGESVDGCLDAALASPRPGARYRWFPTAAAASAPTRTSSTAASPG